MKSQQAPAAAPAPAAAQPQPQPQPASAVDFRLVQAKPAAQLQAIRVRGQVLHILPTPVLTRADLASVVPMKTKEGAAFLRLQFTPEGAGKLGEITRRNVGNWLLFTVNNQFVELPRIGGPVANGVIDIGMGSEQNAINVANLIVGAPPANAPASAPANRR
ncbi:preprotein translocase subunit SecD [Achromobacter sp. SD115]|uniref:SecDF P1 head subdomain-containing protein n=1 Tax=Achromobacter sp. SD115 TaxID=2782011 RepID=UPI001A95B335|nr:preprotein translocase subunit SecD [Achromobacter sp. SD115]MBO1013247.1 preprotein translocase subunit SecD [Achromobacter sp. SD115]